MKKLIILLAAIALTGCGIIKVKQQFCKNIPDGSYSVLCEIANHYGTSPDEVAMTLKLTNIAAMENSYTAQEAADFIGTLIEDLQDYKQFDFTYENLITLIKNKLFRSKKAAAVLIVLDQFAEIDLPDGEIKFLSPYDWLGIEKHLQDQLDIINSFLVSQNDDDQGGVVLTMPTTILQAGLYRNGYGYICDDFTNRVITMESNYLAHIHGD